MYDNLYTYVVELLFEKYPNNFAHLFGTVIFYICKSMCNYPIIKAVNNC